MVRKKFSKKAIALGICGTGAAVFLLTFYIWHQVEAIRLGYDSRKLEEQVLQLTKEVKALEAEKAFLLRLERVEKIAREKLGYTEPRDDQIIDDESIPNFGK